MRHERSPRIPVSQPAEIILAGQKATIRCTVRNLSANGACLEFASTSEASPTLSLILNHRKYACRVIWKTERRVGVTFQ
jgi:hypothetical protein